MILSIRLNNRQREIIERTAIRHFGKDVRVYIEARNWVLISTFFFAAENACK
jgi:hypothetical protein